MGVAPGLDVVPEALGEFFDLVLGLERGDLLVPAKVMRFEFLYADPESRRYRAEFVSYSSRLGQLPGDAGRIDEARPILEETYAAASGLSADYPSIVGHRLVRHVVLRSKALSGPRPQRPAPMAPFRGRPPKPAMARCP